MSIGATSSTREAGRGRSLKYLPSFDGVRAIAVLAVIGVHLGYGDNGNNGVTVFFVLSGFLITALLLEEYDGYGRIGLGHFYIRRGLRLLPALIVALAAHSAYVSIFWSGYQRKAGLAAAALAFLYSSNWCLAYHWLPLGNLAHTWSLAVEEQFYFIWPLLLLLGLRFLSSRRTLAVVTGLVAVSLTAERFVLAGLGADETRLYAGLDTRADALLLGAVAGMAFRYGWLGKLATSRTLLQIAGAVILLVFVAHLFFGVVTIDRSKSVLCLATYSIVAIFSAVLLLTLSVTSQPATALNRLLSMPPLVYIGKISYGLYIWHYTLFAMINERLGISRDSYVLLKLALLLIVCTVSYYAIEQPCLRLKNRFAPRLGTAAS